MNKQELIDAIAQHAELSKADAKRALDAFIEIVKTQLKKGGDVRLIGFGTFSVRKRKARQGVNPQTKEPIKIRARKVPHFTPGAELRAIVDKG